MIEITSVAQAVDRINELAEDVNFLGNPNENYSRFPFGLWFRGQYDFDWLLQPSVFRTKTDLTPESEHYDELDIFVHMQLRAPEYRPTHRSTFDWLCLLQHYSLPTRLLDWSESILFALYFSVKDSAESTAESTKDARLSVLNTRKLNKYVRGKYTLFIPSSFHTIIRAEMARFRSKRDLILNRTVQEAAKAHDIDLDKSNNLDSFTAPIAVFPERINHRMIFQQGVFTLHGGKLYGKVKPEKVEDFMPSPKTLEDIDKEVDILRHYIIPRGYKDKIKEDLFRLGIHEGTLFPEIDRQAAYLKKLQRSL